MRAPEKQLSTEKSAPKTEDKATLDEIFSLVYEDLRKSAASLRRHEMCETVTTTALVHESWFKLKDSPYLAGLSPAHFKSIAIRAMRQVLVEEARRRLAHKRDCDLLPLTGDIAAKPFLPDCVDFLIMNTAITELERISERQANVVCMRVFGGETMEEIAESLKISKSSVERDWRIARAWLAVRIGAKNKEE
jgi:RNA polymerase sigma-70 factor, ECF subfamily